MTPKQKSYLRALMVEAGHIHPRGFFRASAKFLPHNPTCRERAAGFDAWAGRLTKHQASEVIDALLAAK